MPRVVKTPFLDEYSRPHLLSIPLDPCQSLSAPTLPTAAQAVTPQALGGSPTLPRRSHGDLALLVKMLSLRALQEVTWLQRSTITTLLEERRWRTWASSSPS